MSEQYVPSDDHIRSLFCQGYAQGDFDKHDQAWSAWEKWLAAHDARVRREAYDWGRYDERMSHAYAPPEAPGGPVNDDETPEEEAWRRTVEMACGRDVCWKLDGHDGPCKPGGRPHPDEEETT